jgi:indole-3-glycerol phosphate synthase
LSPSDKILVGESGIRTIDDVRRMAAMGCDAILVGETFCKLPQAKRGAEVKAFVQAGSNNQTSEGDR